MGKVMDSSQIQSVLRWGIISGIVVGIAYFLIKNPFKRHSCPECKGTKIRLVEQKLERIAKHLGQATHGGIQDVHIPIMKNHYECNACHHKWDELSA